MCPCDPTGNRIILLISCIYSLIIRSTDASVSPTILLAGWPALLTQAPAPLEKRENVDIDVRACCLFLCTLSDAIYILHFSFK